jgi:hypothetical protein
MKLVVYRLWQMLLGWGFVGVIYHGSDRWQGAGHLLTPGWGRPSDPVQPARHLAVSVVFPDYPAVLSALPVKPAKMAQKYHAA